MPEEVQPVESPPIEVVLDSVIYIVNELTGRQDMLIAKIISDDDLDSLFTMIKSGQLGIDVNNVSLETIAPLIKALRKMLADDKLTKLLAIVLVPKSDPKSRPETVKILEEFVGDLPNSKIGEIFADFFGKNSLFGKNYLNE